MRSLLNTMCVMAFGITVSLGCATQAAPRPAQPAEHVGDLSGPETVCDLSAIDHHAADVLVRVLKPGDRVLSVENRRQDLVSVRVHSGTENWILWLQKHDGRWDAIERPPDLTP